LEIPENLKEAIPVLDKGFVRLVDFMGNDDAIVQAARVSYGDGTKTVLEDKKLIHYLMRHDHSSPFEMVELKFHIKLPIFIARQWIRHRTANVNEYSGRYSIMKNEAYLPDKSRMVKQSKTNKQASSKKLIGTPNLVRDSIYMEQYDAFSKYEWYLEEDLSREMARINLPLSTYTEWYWKIDLHNLFHFLRLRLHKHAQLEIRLYAEAMYGIIKQIVPIACEAWYENKLNVAKITRGQLATILLDIDTDIDSVKKQISKLLEEANVYTD